MRLFLFFLYLTGVSLGLDDVYEDSYSYKNVKSDTWQQGSYSNKKLYRNRPQKNEPDPNQTFASPESLEARRNLAKAAGKNKKQDEWFGTYQHRYKNTKSGAITEKKVSGDLKLDSGGYLYYLKKIC